MRRLLILLAGVPMTLGTLGLVVGRLTNDDMTGEALGILAVGVVGLAVAWILT
jgi:hypothetical protein